MAKSVWRREMACAQHQGGENCEYCGGQLINDFERGQCVCRDCGTVVGNSLLSAECELSLEELSHGSASYVMGVCNTGPPTTLGFHDLGISTEIGGGFRDGKGRPLTGKARYRAVVLRNLHSRTRTKDGKDLSIAKSLSTLNDLANQLDLPAYVREEACGIYRRTVEKRLTIGRSKHSLVAVSLYAAIRRAKLPIMLRDVLPIFGMRSPEFNLYLNLIKRFAQIEVPPPDPVAWIPRIASECHYSQRCQLLAAEYIRSMVEAGETFGLLPHVVAAIALYRTGAVNGEQKNIYEVAQLANCAATSILKGLVSDSQTQRKCRKHRPTKVTDCPSGDKVWVNASTETRRSSSIHCVPGQS